MTTPLPPASPPLAKGAASVRVAPTLGPDAASNPGLLERFGARIVVAAIVFGGAVLVSMLARIVLS